VVSTLFPTPDPVPWIIRHGARGVMVSSGARPAWALGGLFAARAPSLQIEDDGKAGAQ
jgi:hypothetical protein